MGFLCPPLCQRPFPVTLPQKHRAASRAAPATLLVESVQGFAGASMHPPPFAHAGGYTVGGTQTRESLYSKPPLPLSPTPLQTSIGLSHAAASYQSPASFLVYSVQGFAGVVVQLTADGTHLPTHTWLQASANTVAAAAA